MTEQRMIVEAAQTNFTPGAGTDAGLTTPSKWIRSQFRQRQLRAGHDSEMSLKDFAVDLIANGSNHEQTTAQQWLKNKERPKRSKKAKVVKAPKTEVPKVLRSR